MRLKKIVIHGFKSFADRVVVEFSEGITAIVGPNGCGKSNISDAFRWVMGEQSAKSLRGGKMPDVIFAGTSTRKPMNFAEVTLTLTDIKGDLPVEYDEVAITRRLHRSGESEYLINRNPVRLKDIQSLFLDSGIGKKSFSIFEQGKIDEVINLGPNERRRIFEEAAGILRFLERKREALRKLKQTDENMNRVLDIHKEVEQQIEVLEKQAEQARAYKSNQGELAKLEKAVAVGKWDELAEKIANAMEREVDLKDKIADGQQKLEALGGEIKESKSTLADEEMAFRRQSEEVYQRRSTKTIKLKERQANEERLSEGGSRQGKLKQELEAILMDRKMHGERAKKAGVEKKEVDTTFEALEEVVAGSEEQVKGLESEVTELRDRQQELQQNRVRLLQEETRTHGELQQDKVRVESAEERLEQLGKQKSRLENRVTDLDAAVEEKVQDLEFASVTVDSQKAALEAADGELATIKEESDKGQKEQEALVMKSAESGARLKALKRLQEEMEGFSTGAKALLQAADLKGKVQGLYELIQAKEGGEQLISACMRPYSQTLACATEAHFQEVLRYAADHDLRDFSLVCLEHMDASSEGSALLERVADSAAARRFLGGISVASDVTAGLTLVKGNAGLEVMTEKGTHIDRRGVLFFTTQGENNLFMREAEIKSLTEELATWHAREQILEKELDALFQKQLDASQRRSIIDREIRQGEMKLVEVNFGLQQAKKEQAAAHTELEGVDEESERLDRDLKRRREQIQLATQQSEELSQRNKSVQEEIGSVEKGLHRQLLMLEERKRDFAVKNAEFRQITERRRELTHEVHLLEVKVSQGEERQEAIQEELDQLATRQESAQSRDSGFEKEMAQVEALLKEAEAAQEKLEKLITDKKQKIESTEEKLQKLQERLAGQMEEGHKVGVRIAERRSVQDAVENDLYERHSLTVDDARALGIELERPLDESEKRMKLLRGEIKRSGDINMTSIEEFERHKVRHQFLNEQLGDLGGSKGELLKVIEDLDGESRRKFTVVFDQIREYFQKNFKILFNGGEADLSFTDSGDILEAGIDIVAKPPGKKMRSISLLSGGEKCMTAMALLFAIFEVKSAPFCMLDEIDAPLDDSNIRRFVDVVQQFTDRSQFIIITHNKRTMSIADRIFGITMQERGVSKLLSMQFSKGEELLDEQKVLVEQV